MSCGQCKYWDEESIPNTKFKNHGCCEKAVFFTEASADDMIITSDANCYKAHVYTHKDHVCGEMTERS